MTASGDDAAPQDLAAVLAGLQEQITDLTEALESHQQLFERLRAKGLLTCDDDGDRP